MLNGRCRESLTWFVTSRHAENLNNRMCSKMNLFRATVFLNCAHSPLSVSVFFFSLPIFAYWNLCFLLMLWFLFESDDVRSFVWDLFENRYGKKRSRYSLAHLFYVSNSINTRKLRSSNPSGRTGQLSYFFLRFSQFCCAVRRTLRSHTFEIYLQSIAILCFSSLFIGKFLCAMDFSYGFCMLN